MGYVSREGGIRSLAVPPSLGTNVQHRTSTQAPPSLSPSGAENGGVGFEAR